MLVFGGVDVQAGRRKHSNRRLGETFLHIKEPAILRDGTKIHLE